jgi:hypothetical protein
MDTINYQERILRIRNIEETDYGLYRCIQGDMTLNEIFLDVLSKYSLFKFILTKQTYVREDARVYVD